jgi:hypothetical protein
MVVVVIHHIAEEAVEEVEASLDGRVRGCETEMPFADDSGVVAGPLEKLRQKHRLRGQIPPAIGQVRADYPRHADQVRVFASQQRSSRGRANRTVGVEVVEPHTSRNEAVNVRSFHILWDPALRKPCAIA